MDVNSVCASVLSATLEGGSQFENSERKPASHSYPLRYFNDSFDTVMRNVSYISDSVMAGYVNMWFLDANGINTYEAECHIFKNDGDEYKITLFTFDRSLNFVICRNGVARSISDDEICQTEVWVSDIIDYVSENANDIVAITIDIHSKTVYDDLHMINCNSIIIS